MESLNIEETQPASTAAQSAKTSFFQRHKRVIIAIITAVILLIIIGVVLAIVLTRPKKTITNETTLQTITTTTIQSSMTTTKTEQINSRMDCLPWLKNKTDQDLEKECNQRPNCKFQSIDGNVVIPSCFYEKSLTKLAILSTESTKLGSSYTIGSRSGSKESDVLRVDFEYLEDSVLRFKVF